MSDHSTNANIANAGHDAGHDDEHDHAADALGPIDWKMWSVGVVGVVAALLVLAAFMVATGYLHLDVFTA